MRQTKETQNGITLISLIVTIIVLLILAGISIATLNGDNGIIKKSKEAKEQTEISEEKEVVDRATVQAMENNKKGELIESNLQEELDKIVSSGKTEVTDTGEEFEILFRESNRYYIVDEEGNILEQQTIEKMEYAGDITKNGQYDGSAERPYQISCIEDLVALSNISRGKGKICINGKIEEVKKGNTFLGKNIELTRNLNFKSNYSYADSSRTDFGDLNTNGNIESIREELTNTDEGCIGFAPINVLEGSFNGNNFKIANIYINSKEAAGLFIGLTNCKCANVRISGKIKGIGDTGGICARGNKAIIDNCINYADVTGSGNCTGGICGVANGGSLIIKNCSNHSDIQSTIAKPVGGILAWSWSENVNVYNCFNTGSIDGTGTKAGIIGSSSYNNSTKMVNCYNIGIMKNNRRGTGLLCGYGEGTTIINSYYKKTKDMMGIGIKGAVAEMPTVDKSICYDDIDMRGEKLLNALNDYVDNNLNIEGKKQEYKKWKRADNGYPELEI